MLPELLIDSFFALSIRQANSARGYHSAGPIKKPRREAGAGPCLQCARCLRRVSSLCGSVWRTRASEKFGRPRAGRKAKTDRAGSTNEAPTARTCRLRFAWLSLEGTQCRSAGLTHAGAPGGCPIQFHPQPCPRESRESELGSRSWRTIAKKRRRGCPSPSRSRRCSMWATSRRTRRRLMLAPCPDKIPIEWPFADN